MDYFYVCLQTFILSDFLFFTKSMNFYVQKNNNVVFILEKEGGRGGERRPNQKWMKTMVNASRRPSKLLLPIHMGSSGPGKTPSA